jgi:subfamily B ATP-binding cassette protein MsbA
MKNPFTFQHIKPYAGRTSAYIFCVVLSVLFTIATALSVSDFLKILFHEPGEAGTIAVGTNAMAVILQKFYVWLITFGRQQALVYFSLLLFAVYSMKNVFGYVAAVLAGTVRAHVVCDVRNQMHGKMLRLPVSYFVRHRKGDMLSRFSSDVSEYEENILGSLQLLVTSATGIVLYLAMLFYLDVRLTLFTLCTFPVVGIVISRISRKLKHKSAALQEKSSLLMSLIEETMTGLKIVKAYTAIDFSNARFRAANEDYTKLRTRVYRRIYLASPVSDFMGNVIVICILLFGSLFIFRGDGLAPELFISYIMLFVLIIAPAKDFSTALSQMKKGQACTERISQFLALPEAETAFVATRSFAHLQQGIELRHVWFAYDGEETGEGTSQEKDEAVRWVLKDVSLSIPKGKKIALTGSSGSGKSTLTDLLMRYYDCQKGEILVDGEDLRSYHVADWRRCVGAVAQDTDLFNDTVFHNITFGAPHATQEEVEAAARLANAHDFIMQLPEGYNTNIGDRGSQLSGGQRQRLSIARAVLRNPDIIILDEATSALDTESEHLVQQAMEQAMQGRTVIMIAHRLSTIVNADEIVVLENGEIVEQGTHHSLLQQAGRYKQLWDASTRLVKDTVVGDASQEVLPAESSACNIGEGGAL